VGHGKDYQGLAHLGTLSWLRSCWKPLSASQGGFLISCSHHITVCFVPNPWFFFLSFVVLSTVEGHTVISLFPLSSRLFSYSSEICWALTAGVLGTSPGPHWREPSLLSSRNPSSRKTDVWSNIYSTAWRALGEHREASEGWLWLGKAPRGGVTPARCAGLYLCPWEEALLFGRGDPYLKAPFSAQ
jgi:hypothetical protein